MCETAAAFTSDGEGEIYASGVHVLGMDRKTRVRMKGSQQDGLGPRGDPQKITKWKQTQIRTDGALKDYLGPLFVLVLKLFALSFALSLSCCCCMGCKKAPPVLRGSAVFGIATIFNGPSAMSTV